MGCGWIKYIFNEENGEWLFQTQPVLAHRVWWHLVIQSNTLHQLQPEFQSVRVIKITWVGEQCLWFRNKSIRQRTPIPSPAAAQTGHLFGLLETSHWVITVTLSTETYDKPEWHKFTPIIIFHLRKITGFTNAINDVSVLFKCPIETWQRDSEPAWKIPGIPWNWSS